MSSHPAPQTNGLPHEWDRLTERERRIVQAILHGKPVSRDVNQTLMEGHTFGQRMADRIAAFGGSWPFILMFLAFLAGWMALNSGVLGPRREAFDPFPYILLNLILSTLAALQAPVIMMSQNRQALRDRLDAANDYDVNLKAEMEIRALHEKLDALPEADWSEVVRLQREQIRMLERLLAAQGGAPGDTPGQP